MQFERIVQDRRSVKHYDPSYRLSDEDLRRLFSTVILSPSSFNLQHWRFVVVRDLERKKALRKAAYDQEQVEKASAVILVAARLAAHEDADRIYRDVPEKVRSAMLPMIRGFYEGRPDLQRDEAIRSASLAAMTLMFAAQNQGLATGPMIGFDPEAVSSLLGLEPGHIPVMLVVIGKPVGEMRSRGSRLPLPEVVKLESWTGASLS